VKIIKKNKLSKRGFIKQRSKRTSCLTEEGFEYRDFLNRKQWKMKSWAEKNRSILGKLYWRIKKRG